MTACQTTDSVTVPDTTCWVYFVAEDPRKEEHLRRILSKAMAKLSPIELRHSDKSQDEGVNRLKDEVT